MSRLLAAGFAIVFLCAAAHISLRALTKEESGTQAAIQAQLDEQNGSDPIPQLRKAVELSPREALYHSRLGLALEARGNLASAERELLAGVELSRKYQPRWNLLNYYFRRGNWERFWPTAGEALPISWGPRAALFELALQAEGGRARLEPLLPANRDARMDYTVFLITKGEMEAAAPFIASLAPDASPEEREMFLFSIDLLLDRRLVAPALDIWKALKVQDDTPFRWKSRNSPGVTSHRTGDTWEFRFSGMQPEQCVLLETTKLIGAGAGYHLEPNLEDRLTPPGGLEWHIETLEAKPRSLPEAFTAPAGVEAVRIRLEYRRQPGSVRGEGEVRLKPVFRPDRE